MENFTEEDKSCSYEEIRKNTVKAENQLKKSEFVSFENYDGKGIRVMFVGNSITRHGIKHDIGWHNDWGMAASAKEKDYVHRLISEINKHDNDAAYCICQVATWEREYMNGTEKLCNLYESARDFDADIIVLRFIENCSIDSFDKEIFKKELKKLADYLNLSGNARFIITTGFWRHVGDEAICEYAQENNIPLAELGDLGDDPKMKALGLFEHDGVANHPGDLGMKNIADRIYEKIKLYIK